jgi:hypothetical protein
MSTQPIEHKGYGYTLKQPRRHREDVDFPLGPESSKKQQETASKSGFGVRDRIRQLLADVPRQNDNRLSFMAIRDYRDVLEKGWEVTVSTDLRSMGVDVDRKFRLTLDASSQSVVADNDHPDKLRIEQYFLSNGDKSVDMDSLLQLGKLVDVAEQKLSPDQMTQTLDAEAMGLWFQSNMESSALFRGGGMVFGLGGAAYKGLDIRV